MGNSGGIAILIGVFVLLMLIDPFNLGSKKVRTSAKGQTTVPAGATRTKAKNAGSGFLWIVIIFGGLVIFIWASHPELLPPSMR